MLKPPSHPNKILKHLHLRTLWKHRLELASRGLPITTLFPYRKSHQLTSVSFLLLLLFNHLSDREMIIRKQEKKSHNARAGLDTHLLDFPCGADERVHGVGSHTKGTNGGEVGGGCEADEE
jgi:hypothetical protein